MASQKLGVALIGSGIFITEEHLPAVQACGALELKAIYSRTLKSAQTLSKDLDAVDLYSDDSEKSYQDLIARTDIHTVIIALPIPIAPTFIKQALQTGKHVLGEKPLAPDVATGSDLLDWYEKNIDTKRVLFGVAENWRHFDISARAAERVREFGKVQAFNARFHYELPDNGKWTSTAWRKQPEYQGGYILDSGVHVIAAIRRILGPGTKIQKVSAFVTSQAAHLPPVDTVAVTLLLSNGSAGILSMSYATKFLHGDISVACEGGTVDANMFTLELKSNRAGGDETTESVKDEAEPVTKEVAVWAKSLEQGELHPSLSPREALADVEVIEAILKSNGSPFELKYQI